MESEEVKAQVVEGLKKGYQQNLLLTSSYSLFIDQVREYLLTVNVAQQLLTWNSQHNFKIHLEYPVRWFYENAFLASKVEIGKDVFEMNMLHRESGHSPTDNLRQKIDIAITKDELGDLALSHERSLCGIELKAINKKESHILADAKRLSRAMKRTDKISENSISVCFCGFLRRLDTAEEVVTEDITSRRKNLEETKWSHHCYSLKKEFPMLKFEIDSFDIESTSYESVANFHQKAESDYSEVANDTGLVVGYILSIRKDT